MKSNVKRPKVIRSESDIDTFAVSLIRGITAAREKAHRDERSKARYWNCDDWGSISGIRDAEEWVEGQVARYVVGRLREFQKAKP